MNNKTLNKNLPGLDQEYSSFFDVIEQFGIIKKFQNNLYRLTGLPFDFLDIGQRHSRKLQAQRVFMPFCRMINDTPLGCDACARDEKQAVEDCINKQDCILRRCHLGLIDVYVPVVMNGKIVGLFCTGQFSYKRITQKCFKRIQKRLTVMGLDVAKARQAYFSVPVFARRDALAVVGLIQMMVGLIDAGRLQTLSTATRHDPLRKAMDFMEVHYADPITLPVVAKKSGLSVSRLAHVFKAHAGMSFTACVNLIRINRVKYYLANSRLRVSETAFQVGFSNLSHFNHVFRQSTGVSPSQYRRQQDSTSK